MKGLSYILATIVACMSVFALMDLFEFQRNAVVNGLVAGGVVLLVRLFFAKVLRVAV